MSRETTPRLSISEAYQQLRQNPEAGFITPGMASGLGKVSLKAMRMLVVPAAAVGLAVGSANYYTSGHADTTLSTEVKKADLKRIFDLDLKCVGGAEANIVVDARAKREFGLEAISQSANWSARVDRNYIGPLCLDGNQVEAYYDAETNRAKVTMVDGKVQTIPYTDLLNPNSVAFGKDWVAQGKSAIDSTVTWASAFGKDDIPGANGTTQVENVLRDLATLRGEDVFANACLPAAWNVGLKDIVERRLKLNTQRDFTAAGFDFDPKQPGNQILPLENIDVELPEVISGTLPKEHQDKINQMREAAKGAVDKDGFIWNFDGPQGTKKVECTTNVVIKEDKSLETAEDKKAQDALAEAARKAETGEK